MSSKRTKLRFSIFDDLILLREILGQNPFENKARWSEVCKNTCDATSKSLSLRTIKEHSEHLLTLFRRNDRSNLRESGTEEQYDEKKQLLQQISDLERDFKIEKVKNPSKLGSANGSQGVRERDKAASSHFSQKYVISDSDENEEDEREDLSTEQINAYETEEDVQTQVANFEPGSELPPVGHQVEEEVVTATGVLRTSSIRRPRSRTVKNNALEYLTEKRDLESKIKEKELSLEERRLTVEERKVALEERKMTLEEAKFEIEKDERVKRLKLEIDERSHKIALEKQLSEINGILVKHLIDK